MSRAVLPRVVLSRKTAEIAACSDEEFFTRESFQLYLNQSLKAVVMSSKAGTITLIVYAADDGSTGCTDGESVRLNVAAPFVQSQKGRQEKLYTIVGLLTHECGHILFTDMSVQKQFLEDLKHGKCRWSSGVERTLAGSTKEFVSFVLEKANYLRNLFEDDYVEIRLIMAFPGLPAVCLKYTRKEAAKVTEESLADRFPEMKKFDRVVSLLLLQVQNSHPIENVEYRHPDAFSEVESFYRKALAIMKKHRENYRSSDRIALIAKAVETLMPLLEDDWEELVKEQEEKSEGSGSGEGSEGSPEGSGEGSGSGSGASGSPAGGSSSRKSAGGGSPEKKALAKAFQDLKDLEALKGEFEHNLKGRPKHLHAGRMRTPMSDLMDAGDPESAAKAELEAARIHEEESDVDTDRRLIIQRAEYTEDMILKYTACCKEVLPIIRRTVRMLNSVLKDRQMEGKLTGQLYGKRMDARQAYRKDGRFFSRELVPDGDPKVCFGIRIDESGSMGGKGIKAARTAAVVIEAILRELKVPYCIYGDTADTGGTSGTVEIRKYAEFDAYDDHDRYRLMGVEARANNHDALAIEVVANALKKRPEEQKVLIVLSDGQPAAEGFVGPAAVRKTAETVMKAEKAGIKVFAAALDDCYRDVRDIYGENRVMDIRNLDMLPTSLTKLVKAYIAGRG